MKRIITILALFTILTIVFSSLYGCKGTQTAGTNNAANANAANANAANSATNTNAPTTGDQATTVYPPLASGIAEGPIALLDGTSTKVSDHKGKVVLLNLWATWCGPCVGEMPALAQLQAKYGDRGFEVIGLDIGNQDGGPESVDKIKDFLTKHPDITYKIGTIDRATTNQFYLVTRQEVVPQTLLISRDGRLRAAFAGGGPRIINLITETLDKAIAE